MPADVYDMAKMTTATSGTGTITLGSAVAGFQSFTAAGVADQAVVSYGIVDTGNAWEIGRGTYTASGTTLTRGPISSSASGAAISLSGAAVVYCTVLGEDFNTLNASNTLTIGNSTANLFANSIELLITNSTANVVVTPVSIFFGNSTANGFGNSIIEIISNSTSQTVITPQTATIGNSTANTFVNSIFFQTVNSTANTKANPGTLTLAGAGSNAGFTLGTSSIAANGFSFLPNGLLLQWGNANNNGKTALSINFPTAFPAAAFSVVLTSNNAGTVNNILLLVNANSTAFAMVSGNASISNVFWVAVGH